MSHQCPMLNEALEKAGVTKAKLAELMNVNRKTISRMGDNLTPEVEVILNTFKPAIQEAANGLRVKEPEEYSMDDIKSICLTRRGSESDYDIAQSLGLKVHELKLMIDWYAKNYKEHYGDYRVSQTAHDKWKESWAA